MISQLLSFRPSVLRGSAKALHQLLQRGLVVQIPVVICSDVIWDRALRTALESRLGCRVFEQAQHETMGGFWFECRYQRMHTHPLFGITEIVRPNGSACAPGEAGEVVLTSLLDTENPIIRVKSGDWAAWADEDRCPCGRSMAILEPVAKPHIGALRDVA
jgi:phenylacetate-CoA ligase